MGRGDSCVRRAAGTSDERCIFLNVHLPSTVPSARRPRSLICRSMSVINWFSSAPPIADYPDERPSVALEGSFGDFKEGILQVRLSFLFFPSLSFNRWKTLFNEYFRFFHFFSFLFVSQAFIEYGNEYASNRHKGLVDIVNFFVVSTWLEPIAMSLICLFLSPIFFFFL